MDSAPTGLRSIRADPRPLYIQVVDAILRYVDETGRVAGDSIPGEPELSKIFDVGRSTIREALIFLENEGLIERSQGARTTLTSLIGRAAMGLEVLEPLQVLAERQGWECGIGEIKISSTHADEEQARRLWLQPGAPVTVIERVKTRDGKPITHETSIVGEEVVSYDVLRREFTDSITALMSDEYKLRHAESEVSAVACPARIASALQIKRNAPVVWMTELFFGDAAQPLAYNVNYIVPGGVRLEILRRVSHGNPARERAEARVQPARTP